MELACKDGLKGTLFKTIEEMLLRIYFLYEKSPKKARELGVVVEELKQVYEIPVGGNKPIRSQGSRWITHKRNALQRIVDRWGAYLCHLTSLAVESSLKSEEKARLIGYVKKWSDSKIIVGCAMYIEILKPASILSKTLRDPDVDAVFAMKQLLKTHDSLKSLKKVGFLQWPTVQLVINRIKEDDDGKKSYQGAQLQNFSPAAVEVCKKQALTDLEHLEVSILHRLEWSNLDLLRSLLVFIETTSWIRCDADEEYEDSTLLEVKLAIDKIFNVFTEPLESIGISLSSLLDEIEDTIEYGRRYLSLESTKYRKVWYLLHVCPDAEKWPSVLKLCELAFSLPFSNGRVEQIFSSLKLTKTDNRTNLHTSTLNDLLEIRIEGPPLSEFSPNAAVEMWWSDCQTTRRPDQKKRKSYSPRINEPITEPITTDDDGDTEASLETILNQWDNMFVDDQF